MANPVTDPEVLARFKKSQTPSGQTLALFDPNGNAPTQPFGPAAPPSGVCALADGD